MHSKAVLGYAADIRRNIDLANSFVTQESAEDFDRDIKTVYSVVRCLEIISEASRRLPDTLKRRHPHIKWSDIAGAGNIYRHNYDGVSHDRVWITLQDSLPALRQAAVAEIETDGL